MCNTSCNFATVWKNTHNVHVNTPISFLEPPGLVFSELLQIKWARFRQDQWGPSAGSPQDQWVSVEALVSLPGEIETQNALDAY